MGGIGGVICDFSGKVVKRFSEPVSSLDSSGAKVYALLVEFRELRKLGGYIAIIEGDSFSIKSSYPWSLVYLVEEVQDISSQLGATFHHTIREANDVADGLVREELLRLNISFHV
eukprot:TRINITY_DN29242_c0_g1_i1.p1 TRINITY_DN29242_c0_g1~~TRINITY_DN29242_c0_g1_i1.p1  ORF type:complete len:115 (+),score=26.47 TRINITY_DN29242_c0_g1_i1:213-557(+)